MGMYHGMPGKSMLAMTDSNEYMTFDERRFVLMSLGVPQDRIIKVSSPYNIKEYETYISNKSDTLCFFFLGEKDRDRFSHKIKKDVTYLQHASTMDDVMVIPKACDKHSYLVYKKTVTHKGYKSSTEWIKAYKDSDDRYNFLCNVYGNIPNLNKIYEIYEERFYYDWH